jgi:hypothetical protein
MYLHACKPSHAEATLRLAAEAAAKPAAASLSHPDVRVLPDDGAWEAHPIPALWLHLPSAKGSGIGDCLASGGSSSGGGGGGGV